MVQTSFAAIINSAVAVGDYQSSQIFSTASLVSIPVTAATPQIQLQKGSVFNDENGNGVADVGETISYTFTVTNTGNVTLSNVTLNDPGITVTGGPIASLQPAAVDSTTFHATYTISLADINAGQKSNTASVSAQTPQSTTVTDQSDSTNPGDDTGADNDPTITPLAKAVIDAVDNDFTASPVNGLVGGSTPTVYDNDTLNSASFPSTAVLPTITNNGGIAGLTISSNGTLNIPAGTPAGSYTVDYLICEVANPTNCDPAQVLNLLVTAATINAVDDDFTATPINSLTGGTTATVYTNDTLNGSSFIPATVTPTITGTGGLTGVTINPADGTLSVPPGTPAGTYVVTYKICEVAIPANCDTGNVTIVVNPAVIVANDDNFSATPVSGIAGGATPTVFTNDTLNGAAFLPTAVTTSITNTGGLTGATIASDGTITVPAATPAGTYNVTYRICEVVNPTNCDTAIATVVISPATIVANDDNFTATPVNSLTGGNTATVFTNDTLNSAAFTSGQVQPSITNTGGLTGATINPDGTITVPPNTPAGTYLVTYQICEVLNPTNCDPAIATVVVAAAPIVATDDNFSASPISGLTGGTTATVYTNDTLNGASFAPSSVTPSIANTGGLIGVTINPNGTLSVPAGTPAGTYTVTYKICEVTNPTNCDTATVQVVVAPPAIVANDDNFTASPVAGIPGGTTASVFNNDTIAGAPFAPASVTPSIANDGGLTGVTINPNGTLGVPAGTPAGTYLVTYQICEVINPTNCDTAIATVVVSSATINAVDDDFTTSPINSTTGGPTPTVFTNDTLNGVSFAPADVTVTLANPSGLPGATINSSGVITVPANTPAGTYTVNYTVCENLNPTNCDSANATIVVAPPAIVANDDNFSSTPIGGASGGTTPTVFTNDTLNGSAIDPTKVIPTIANDGGLTGVVINTNGTLTVPPNKPPGTYLVTYQICEVLNPTNCDTAVATVVVLPVIVATDDNFTAAPIPPGGATATIFTNDTLGGSSFAPAAVNATITNFGTLTGAVLNPNGTITVPVGTAPGDYPLTYQICQKTNPTNCDTAVVTIRVRPATIDAVNDDASATPINGFVGGTIPTVFSNDTLNGSPVTPSAITATIVNPAGLTGLVINSDGTIKVPAGQPAGTYNVTYQICEKANPTNCDTAQVKIVVTAPAIVANNDDFSATPVSTATPSIYGNDTLNGVAVVPGAITPTIVNNGGIAGLTIDPATGVMNIPTGTPPGPYQVTYQICEIKNPSNCDTATVKFVVASALGTVIGTVYHDNNGNGVLDNPDVSVGSNYIVELVDSNGVVLVTDKTDANGAYSITAPIGTGYTLVFRTPTGVVLGRHPDVAIVANSVVEFNVPIDPSGVVYNSVTRLPVAGATVSLVDKNGNVLPEACFAGPGQRVQTTGADGAYRFILVPGADPACPVGETEYRISITNPAGYEPGFSTTLPAQSGALDGTTCPVDPNPGAACVVSPSTSAPTGTPVTYYTTFILQQGDGDVVHNHLPIDPIISTSTALTKKALITQVRRGERVPYVIEATGVSFSPATITDALPVGLDFVPGTATVNGKPIVPVVAGNMLTFNGLLPDAKGKITLEYVAAVTLASATGPKVNKARLINPANGTTAGSAQTTITVMVDHVFDCGDVIGKVFDDANRDGYQDKGEKGLPGVRLVTVKGVLITTDKDGLFHVPCAEVPDAAIGSNFILKLDTRSLPSGYRITTENPRVVRLTAGKVTKLNFGASIGRVVKFDVTGEAFASNSTELKPQWAAAVDKLIGILAADKSTLRLTYVAKTDGSKLAQQRLASLEDLIAEKWDSKGGSYQLPIEKRVVSKVKGVAP